MLPGGAAPPTSWARRYWIFPAAVLAGGLLLFGLVEAVGPPILTDPTPRLQRAEPAVALLGVGLLVVDAALPVPSSLVMVANGAVFGLVAGASLSLVGTMGAFLLGFAAGRRGSGLVRRVLPSGEMAGADRLLARWGLLAIVLSRPVPLLAETVAVVAGASRMRTSRAIVAALAGCLPVAVLYAAAGAVSRSLENATLAFGAVIVVAGVLWVVGRVTSGDQL